MSISSNSDSCNGGGMQTSTQSHSSSGAAHSMSAGEGSAGGSFVHDQGVNSGEPLKQKSGRPRKKARGRPPGSRSKPKTPLSPSGEPLVTTGSFVHDQGVISGEPVKRKKGRPRKEVKDIPPGSPAGEVPIEGLETPKRYYVNKRRGLLNRVCPSDEDRENAHDRAEELQSGLDPDIPSFVKRMLQSHVTGEFWLDLPVEFCKTYLPKHDEIITMVNENDEVFLAKYLALKTGLSAGWRGFVIEHDLVDGDVLVFQMIKPNRFNVYIIRVN